MRKHNFRQRVYALPNSIYPAFRDAAIRLAGEIAGNYGDSATRSVWQGALDGRRMNPFLEEAVSRLTGSTLEQVRDAGHFFDAVEVQKRLDAQTAIWAAKDLSESVA